MMSVGSDGLDEKKAGALMTLLSMFENRIKSYFLNLFLIPASPIKPELKRRIVAGSGTGECRAEGDVPVKDKM